MAELEDRFTSSCDGTVPTKILHSSNRFAATWTIFQDTRIVRLPFVLRYLRQRLASHVVILTRVVAAVACSVGTQYGVKYLVDGLSAGPGPRQAAYGWHSFFSCR